MADKMGIQEIKDLIMGLLKIEQLEQAVMADGKIDLMDIPVVISSLPGIVSAVKAGAAGAKMVPAELADLSEDEANELISLVGSELKLDNEKAKNIVIAGLKAALGLAGLVSAIKA